MFGNIIGSVVKSAADSFFGNGSSGSSNSSQQLQHINIPRRNMRSPYASHSTPSAPSPVADPEVTVRRWQRLMTEFADSTPATRSQAD